MSRTPETIESLQIQLRDTQDKLRKMHRRAQQSERVEQMIMSKMESWYKIHLKSKWHDKGRYLFIAVMKELRNKAKGMRATTPYEHTDKERQQLLAADLKALQRRNMV